MSENDVKTIIDQAIDGNELPFNRFFENTFQKLLPKLISFTKSEEEAKDVYTISMYKFWERFVMNQEELPHNSIGYIFMMCKNAWISQKRKTWKSIILSDNLNEYSVNLVDDSKTKKEIENESRDTLLKNKSLSIALETLSPKCKRLIEAGLENQISLKDLQSVLGYTSYQALVQAKYNCKKKLIHKVYEVLRDLRKNKTAT